MPLAAFKIGAGTARAMVERSDCMQLRKRDMAGLGLSGCSPETAQESRRVKDGLTPHTPTFT